MSLWDLVIFDCDGVLVDSEPISNGVLAEMLNEEGLDLTLEQACAKFQGRRLDGVIAEAQRMLGHDLPADWVQRYERRRSEAFRTGLRPVRGAAEALQAIVAAEIAVCVASQGKLSKTSLSLELTGLDRFFAPQSRFSAHTVRNGKPHPELFLSAASALGAHPSRCAVVEDTAIGVTAAVRAGMRAFGLAADSDPDALEKAGAQVMFSLEELPARLGLP